MSSQDVNPQQTMNEPDKATIEKWKEDSPGGEVYRVDANGKTYYFRKPRRAEFKRFANNVVRDRYEALTTLVCDCLLSPTPEVFLRHVDDYPALPTLIATELDEVFGSGLEVTVKKL